MDHLPLPSRPSPPLFDVPLVSRASYALNAGPFHEFPSRYLPALALCNTRLRVSADDRFLDLIQTWLFFGVISEFFRVEVNVEDFRKAGSTNSRLLCTTRLTHLREQWVRSQHLQTDDKSQPILVERLNVLIQATYACEDLERADLKIAGLSPILLSVRVLLCSLTIAAKGVVKDLSNVDHLLQRLTLTPSTASGTRTESFPFLAHMVENGWCPVQIKELSDTCAATTMFYLACMDRKKPGAGHQTCLASSTCLAYNTDELSTAHQHEFISCSCNLIEIDEAEMMRILEAGEIPLVSCQVSAEGRITVSLTATNLFARKLKKISFTAISHVWAHGMGNPERNALAECKLRRLVARAQILQGPETRSAGSVNMWLDTFCIPVESKGDSLDSRRARLKKLAIQSMTPIYAVAERVLVLDSELDSISQASSSFSELTARIRVCGWMGRAWTLQEGSLASRMCYQFQDGFLFALEGQTRFKENMKLAAWNNEYNEHTQILNDCRQAWFLPAVGRHEGDSSFNLAGRDVQFIDVWNSLIDRHTTKPEDFHDILANLLDFEVTEVRKLSNSRQKMRAMILAQERLPMDIFCLPTEQTSGNEIVERCSGWIPLKPRDHRLQRTSYDRSVRRALTGFTDTPSYFLDAAYGPPGYFVHATNTEKSTFCVLVHRNAKILAHAEVTLPCPLDSLIDCPTDLYIYLATVAGHPMLRDTKHSGACFIITKRRKNALVLEYLCSLTFKQCWLPHPQQNPVYPFFMAQQVDAGMTVEINPGLPPFLLQFRRPLNIARLGVKATLRKKLVFGTIAVFWLIFFIQACRWSFNLDDFSTYVGVVGVYPVFLYFLKYFVVYRWWLRTYIRPRMLWPLLVFDSNLKVLHRYGVFIMKAAWARNFARYVRGRKDRWDRTEDECRIEKTAFSRVDNSHSASLPSAYTFVDEVLDKDTVLTGPLHELNDASYLIGVEGFKAVQSLYRPMASTPH